MGWFDSFRKDIRSDYTAKIFQYSLGAANAIRHLAEGDQEKKGLDDNKWSSILFEFIFFYLHLTDRLAFGQMDEKRRGELMTGLEKVCVSSAVEAVFNKYPEKEKEKVKNACMNDLDISMEEYSKYIKWVPEKDEPPQGTLFWRFDRKIAELAGSKNDIAYEIACNGLLMNSLKGLDIKAFIEKAK